MTRRYAVNVMVPWAFRRRPLALRRLRVAAVGFALTGATMRGFADFGDPSGAVALCAGVFTFLCGCSWAALLDGGRTRDDVVRRWVLSVPLAIANAALTLGTLFMFGGGSPLLAVPRFLEGATLGATLGIIIWGPALILTLLFLGLPIGVARRMAKRGLAGEDRGNAVVAFACASVGLLALLPAGDGHRVVPVEVWAQSAAGVLAVLLAGAVGAAAAMRGAMRRALLREVESGRRSDYRVTTTSDGRRLARVQAAGPAYRVAELEEPICELDEAGRCLQSLAGE